MSKWLAKMYGRAAWWLETSSGSNEIHDHLAGLAPHPPQLIQSWKWYSDLTLGLGLAELPHIVSLLEFWTSEAWPTLPVNGCKGMVDTTLPISLFLTSLFLCPIRLYKNKSSRTKLFLISRWHQQNPTQSCCETHHGALLSVGLLATAQITCPWTWPGYREEQWSRL